MRLWTSPTLGDRRDEFQASIDAALERLRAFAVKHGWERHALEPFVSETRVYADKPTFDCELLTLVGMDPHTPLPGTYCGALEQGVLMVVGPELYRERYPDGDEPDAWSKLLTHEMAHRLHVRVLSGDEEGMGPVWFYEGFALNAAEQLRLVAPSLGPAEIWAVVHESERQDYRKYVPTLDYFLARASLSELVEHAGAPDFVDWLRALAQ